MEDARLTQLIDAWIEGSLSETEKLEFEEALVSSASARRQFWNETSLHGVLHEAAKLDWLPHTARCPKPLPARSEILARFSRWLRLPQTAWGIGCFCLIAALVVASRRAPSSHSEAGRADTSSGEPMSSGIALLTHAVDVVWAEQAKAPEAGAVLGPGWLKFKSGLLQIEFYSGARVLLEGPAEFQLITRSEGFCATGKLSAEVPPQARGFRVGSPRMTVVDLGTAFGFDVNNRGAQVHVFKGEVQFTCEGQADENRTLREGAAVAVDNLGGLKAFEADQSTFASLTRVEQRSSEAQRRRYDQWRSSSRPLVDDAALLLHFDFENLAPGERTIPNRAGHPGTDGALVGCERTDGRWPGKGALEFKRISDRVRIFIGGEFDSVTLAAWLRVDSIDNNFNSLMLSDGFELGGLHWQITKEGRVRLGLGNGDPLRTQQMIPSVADYDSPVIFVPENIGQWVHLAVVYDRGNRRVTHFVDGTAVSTEDLKDNSPRIKVDSADMGNWNNSTRVISSCPIRNFRGRMDEFSFFSRALSPSEIQQLFTDGALHPQWRQISERSASKTDQPKQPKKETKV
jgi:hypothetical protein